MNKTIIFICCIIIGITSISVQAADAPLVHSVFFKLKHDKGSDAERSFYNAAMQLADMPGVQNFKWLNEQSEKNDFDYGLSMVFANQTAYDAYTAHPDHLRFVQEVWTPNVADFMEIDYVEDALAGSGDQWVDMLDKTLSKWEVWTGVPNVKVFPQDMENGKPAGLGDPFSLYTVSQDANGGLVLNISGQVDGGLISRQSLSDYHLTMEFKWGNQKWPPRLNDPRGSGLLYHSYGEHGFLWKAWKRSLEFQIREGGFGNFYTVGGTRSTISKNSQAIWNPALAPKTGGGYAIRSVDMENPKGQWNRIDLYVLGDSAVYVVNGKVVMALTDAKRHDGTPLNAGQIQIQSEGAECFARDIRIRPITKLPNLQ
ncbi:MAG: family 16 glycoside hydrolase [Anaerohalosphaeraceae bacterium]